MKDFRHKYSYPAPYPEVKVSATNPYYGMVLLEDYAGKVSELSAITQYLYHHVVLEPKYEEVAEILKGVSIVEMHHLEILAETIIKLGVEPEYCVIDKKSEPQYWNSSFIYYGKSLCDRLTRDIADEWAAVANYSRHQKEIDDPFVQDILGRIILDEFYHINLLNKVARKYCKPNIPRSQ